MNTGRAVAIFKDINRRDIEDEERGEAIKTVMGMETKNSISKKDMESVILYLWNLVFTEVEYFDSGETMTVFR